MISNEMSPLTKMIELLSGSDFWTNATTKWGGTYLTRVRCVCLCIAKYYWSKWSRCSAGFSQSDIIIDVYTIFIKIFCVSVFKDSAGDLDWTSRTIDIDSSPRRDIRIVKKASKPDSPSNIISQLPNGWLNWIGKNLSLLSFFCNSKHAIQQNITLHEKDQPKRYQ